MYSLPMLPGNVLYTLLQKFLQAQGNVKPAMIIAGVVCILNIGINYILQVKLSLGLFGSALALVLANGFFV